jgi:hypothetical protein
LFRLRFLFRKPEEQAALQETARLLADYFGDIDLTPSDLAGAHRRAQIEAVQTRAQAHLPMVALPRRLHGYVRRDTGP